MLGIAGVTRSNDGPTGPELGQTHALKRALRPGWLLRKSVCMWGFGDSEVRRPSLGALRRRRGFRGKGS